MQLEINIELKNKTDEDYAHALQPMTVFRDTVTNDIGIRTAERGIFWLTGHRQGVIESSSYVQATPVKVAKLEIEV